MKRNFAADLKSAFPEYTPVTKAPSLSDLERKAGGNLEELESLVRVEATRRYTATNGRDVFLVINPACQSWECANFKSPISVCAPKHIGKLAEKDKPKRGQDVF